MTEQDLAMGVRQLQDSIKLALLKKHMTQVELAKLIGENNQQLNRAIHGDMSPKSVEIRNKMRKVIDF